MKEIGKVTHYYGKIGVAVISLSDILKVGDRIKFEGGKAEFDQTVESMQVNHKPVNEAHPGEEVAIKVNEKARDGAVVYKLEE